MVGRPHSAPRFRASFEPPVHERLYNQRPAWEAQRDTLLAERDAADLAECTFQPRVNVPGSASPRTARPASAGCFRPNASGGPGSVGGGAASLRVSQQLPIHERVAELLRGKSERLSDTRLKLVGGSWGDGHVSPPACLV